MIRRNKRNPLLSACLLTAAATFLPHTPRAFATDWIGPGTDWNTAANWSPGVIPNSSAAVVNFNDGAPVNVNISSSVTIQSLNFNNLGGNYVVTASSNQFLTVQSITVASGVTGFQTIGFANLATGNLLFSSGNLVISNNSQTGSLVLATNTIIGTPSNGGVVFNGPGTITLAASFATVGGNVVLGGMTKNGSGLLDYSGGGAGLFGGLTLNGGILNLDFSLSTTSKLSTGTPFLTLMGGVLELTANAATPVTQTIPGGTTILAAQTDVVGAGAGTVSLNLGTTTRSLGATMDVSAGGSTTFTVGFSGLSTVNGILGSGSAFMTFNNGATWATSTNGTTVSGLATYSANSFNSIIANCDVTTSSSQSNFSVNSLRFNTGNLSLTLTGNNVIQSGGILQTPSSSGALISGGTISPTTGELIVQVYSVNGMTIASSINATSLTKSGPGLLAINGNNFGLTGAVNINRGSLDVENAASVSAASKINFNDLRSGSDLQTFTVDLGNGVNATLNPAISLAAFASPLTSSYGTYFSTGFSTNSRVTLAGVISSAPGQSTSLLFTGNSSNNSGFNLTNTNTFTGNIDLSQGLLGINADAALGNASNLLVLQNGSLISGGLVFLNSGVNVIHAVSLLNAARIVSNGTDSNTISAPVSGNGILFKDGTGALALTSNANSFNGSVVNAGTLVVGSDANLGASSGQLILNGGSLEATSSFTMNSSRAVGINFGTATITTDPFATLTITQAITGSNAMIKAGAGTLALSSATPYTLSTVTVSAGALALTQTTFNGAAFTNNSLVTGSAAFTNGSFTNAGSFIATGPLTIASSGASFNTGNLALAGPFSGLSLAGAGLSNSGAITLNGALVSGTAALTNSAGGTISGPGIISSAFTNNAGATLFNSAPGTLNITLGFVNAGIIQLASAASSLSGSLITNSGMITGFGTVSNFILNTTVAGVTGTIEPTGGTLIFTNTLTNIGTMRTSTGTRILIQGLSTFPTNNGLISLAGGTFDTGGQPLTNSAQIAGFGTLATGGLTNDGAITFTGGISTVNGNLTNNAGKTINVQYQPALFTGNVTNLGTINVTGTTITFTGTYSGNAYHSDPATNIFQNSVSIATGGSMTGDSGDKFIFTGGAFTNNGTFKNAGLLQSAINFINAGSFTQSGDQSWAPGTTFTNDPGATAEFASDAGSPTSSPLSIIFNGGTVIFDGQQDLNAITINAGHLYVGPDFSYLTDSASPLPLPNLTLTPADLAFIASIPTPEPTSLALLALPAILLLSKRKRVI